MTNDFKNTPAFPATFAQDSLGRIVVPVPGFTKIEYAALFLLPHYLEANRTVDLAVNGNKVTPLEAAIHMAELFLDKLEEKTNPHTLSNIHNL